MNEYARKLRSYASNSTPKMIDEQGLKLILGAADEIERLCLLQYQTGTPIQVGVYACRTPFQETCMAEDKFLMWMDGKWWYMSSDQRYRGEVSSWIGPLPRRGGS